MTRYDLNENDGLIKHNMDNNDQKLLIENTQERLDVRDGDVQKWRNGAELQSGGPRTRCTKTSRGEQG